LPSVTNVLGLVHERKGEWKQALAYCQNVAAIYHDSLSSQHPDVIQVQRDIQPT
jgi:hypothetical protein